MYDNSCDLNDESLPELGLSGGGAEANYLLYCVMCKKEISILVSGLCRMCANVHVLYGHICHKCHSSLYKTNFFLWLIRL